jgi:hypothetical protein
MIRNIKRNITLIPMSSPVTLDADFLSLEGKLLNAVISVTGNEMRVEKSGIIDNPYMTIMQEGRIVAFIDYKGLLSDRRDLPVAKLQIDLRLEFTAGRLYETVRAATGRTLNVEYAQYLTRPEPFQKRPELRLRDFSD